MKWFAESKLFLIYIVEKASQLVLFWGRGWRWGKLKLRVFFLKCHR